ncbi:hypothetical protein ACFQ1M_04465 [Sungkyunkwania multivorans]|uniref:Uncharacterized protein n=1 Tax=Sungkyunkwania multivorans TaxID=1173618 RepID=A0ABW3CUR4_9FLAO
MKDERVFAEHTKQLLKEVGVENPPFDFADKVMHKIEAVKEVQSIPAKPVFGWRAWMAVASFVGLVVFLVINTSSTLALPSFVSEVVDGWELPSINFALPAIDLPNILVYCSLIFGAFVFIQFLMIKQRLDRSFT